MAGLKVNVVERRGVVVGGAAVTEEFHPGFRNSVASYTVGLLNPTVIRDLRFTRTVCGSCPRKANNFVPAPDGRALLTRQDETAASIAELSPADAARYGDYAAAIDAAGDLLRPLLLQTPPNLPRDVFAERLRETVRAAGLLNRLRGQDRGTLLALHALLTKSAGDYLDGWFEDDLVKPFSASTPSSATMPAPTLPVRPMCSCTTRSGDRWTEGRLGTRHRRDGRDHAGDGAPRRRAWRVGLARVARATGARGRRTRRRRGARRRRSRLRARRRRQRQSEAALPEASSAGGPPARRTRRDADLSVRIGDLPHERRSQRPAALLRPADRRRRPAPHRGDHPRAQPRLHGPRLLRRKARRLEPRADRGNADPLDARRHACSAGAHVASLFCQHTAFDLPAASPGTIAETLWRI